MHDYIRSINFVAIATHGHTSIAQIFNWVQPVQSWKAKGKGTKRDPRVLLSVIDYINIRQFPLRNIWHMTLPDMGVRWECGSLQNH